MSLVGFFRKMLTLDRFDEVVSGHEPTNAAGTSMPTYGKGDKKPKMLCVEQPDGRMSQYPPVDTWDDWTEWDAKAWPRRVPRNYSLVPTICFNCESACGLLAYVDKTTFEVRKFEGNPAHPGSRGRNCAKGPATHNQTYDPERILHPLKRVGERGEGKWKRISWDEALEEVGAKMRASRERRRDGIMYHVGRPGEDHYTNRVISTWGVDGHNSHTNICSAAARLGYFTWAGGDRPSPDHANARVILLISSHLETGHYFNPHAQRIIEAKLKGAKIITLDPRLSNTAARSDVWLPTWPGSEQTLLLSVASYLIRRRSYNRDFVRRWVNWQAFLDAAPTTPGMESLPVGDKSFEDFERCLEELYSEFTFERAAKEAEVPIERIEETARLIEDAGDRLSAHVWRSASMGNLGGWQVARCLFFLNVLTGSVGTKGGTSLNSWNKFVPKPFKSPPAFEAWNELHLPHEWPLAFYEMSFLLPHFIEEGRGDVDVYFTRVYNPMWINPDGFMWMRALRDEEKIKTHVALTPTWNESAWFADYVLPMGHAGERHDLMSQETHAGAWIGFRQPVRRVAMERAGKKITHTHEANPGEVWEEAEFWVELSGRMDPDGSLGIRKWFESPKRPGELVTQDEYWAWIFENSVPGLPEAAAKEDLSPLAYMRKYGAFEVVPENYTPFEKSIDSADCKVDEQGRLIRDGNAVGVMVDEVARVGFGTPSRKLEFFSPTLRDWGWPEREHVVPWTLESHVHRSKIDREEGEMILLPNFRLPTLIHTRSANAKWLYELSHKNPVWMHPSDAERIGATTGELIRVETEIGWFVDKVWVTEGIKPGIVAMSHHLGRWRLQEGAGGNPGMTALADLEESGDEHKLKLLSGGRSWESCGAHCWLQRCLSVRKAKAGEEHGDVFVDTGKSREVYRQWHALTRSAVDHSPDGTRRPFWFKRPLKPVPASYKLPEKPFGRDD
jgi:anaerobic selenocysteine-containing dehydrogenase